MLFGVSGEVYEGGFGGYVIEEVLDVVIIAGSDGSSVKVGALFDATVCCVWWCIEVLSCIVVIP